METYIVETDGTEETRTRLKEYCHHVGAPRGLSSFIIIRTEHSVEYIRNIPGVCGVEVDSMMVV